MWVAGIAHETETNSKQGLLKFFIERYAIQINSNNYGTGNKPTTTPLNLKQTILRSVDPHKKLIELIECTNIFASYDLIPLGQAAKTYGKIRTEGQKH